MTIAAEMLPAEASTSRKPLTLPAAAVLQRGPTHAHAAADGSDVSRLLATLDESAKFAASIRDWFSSGTPADAAAAMGHVWFNSPLNSAVDITPYSQIYGMHPKFFNFDAQGSMEVSGCADEWRGQHARSP